VPRGSGFLGALSNGWLLAAGVILLGQAIILPRLSVPEVNTPAPELENLPRELGPWKISNEASLEPDVLNFLKPDRYILRDYVNPSRGTSMNLFVAFFKALETTAGPHAPHECLPGNGWLITSTAAPKFHVPGWNRDVQVNQYTMEKDGHRILVVYWYQNDRRVWSQEVQAKLTLLPDLIRYRRTDGSLVRLTTPLEEDGTDQAFAMARQFTSLLFPSLVRTFRQAG